MYLSGNVSRLENRINTAPSFPSCSIIPNFLTLQESCMCQSLFRRVCLSLFLIVDFFLVSFSVHLFSLCRYVHAIFVFFILTLVLFHNLPWVMFTLVVSSFSYYCVRVSCFPSLFSASSPESDEFVWTRRINGFTFYF